MLPRQMLEKLRGIVLKNDWEVYICFNYDLFSIDSLSLRRIPLTCPKLTESKNGFAFLGKLIENLTFISCQDKCQILLMDTFVSLLPQRIFTIKIAKNYQRHKVAHVIFVK